MRAGDQKLRYDLEWPNLFTNCNFRGGTEIGKGGPLLAAKISPGGPILEGGPKFSLQPHCVSVTPWPL